MKLLLFIVGCLATYASIGVSHFIIDYYVLGTRYLLMDYLIKWPKILIEKGKED
jgi:hypothetical protein